MSELNIIPCDPNYYRFESTCKVSEICDGNKGYFELVFDSRTGQSCGEELKTCGCPQY